MLLALLRGTHASCKAVFMPQSDNASLRAAIDLARSLHPNRNLDLAPPEASMTSHHKVLHAELIGHLLAFAGERAGLESELTLCRTERSDLISAVSHNVRTPLQVLSLAVDAVGTMGAEGDPRMAGTLGRMKRAIGTLNRHLGDLDDVSRIFDGALKLTRALFVPNDLLEEAAQTATLRLTQPATIRAERTELAAFDCDGSRVVQVLVVFIDNALRYGPRGAPILVRARASEAAVRFEVHDDGEGPSPEIRLRLFRGLFHANAHHVGLGLYIAQGIAHAHGGKIGLESQGAATGTTFFVELPVVP